MHAFAVTVGLLEGEHAAGMKRQQHLVASCRAGAASPIARGRCERQEALASTVGAGDGLCRGPPGVHASGQHETHEPAADAESAS